MKREFLKNLGIEGLTDEVIEKIMKENGADIESAKAKADKTQELENLKSQLKEKEGQLANVNSEIEKFKGMNIEEIQKQVETLKTQNAEFETKSKADKEAFEKQIADQQYDFKVKEFVNSQKFTSDFAKKAFENEFKAQGFKTGEDGNFMGANDYIKSFGEKNQGVFVVEETTETKKPPEFTTNNTNQTASKETGLHFNFTPLRPIPKE